MRTLLTRSLIDMYHSSLQVIEALYLELIQGKLCQLEEMFRVLSSVGRDVREEDIDVMLTSIGLW